MMIFFILIIPTSKAYLTKKACSQDRRCRSINFKSLGSICELNDADKETDPGDYKVNTGYTYSTQGTIK